MFVGSTLNPETLDKFKTKFFADAKNVLAQNACTRVNPVDVCMSRNQLQEMNHMFTHKIDIAGKPVTNQKSSGRCWIFACLNVMRVPFMKAHNLDKFEFSQAYLFFWDKIERSNFFLNTIVKTARRGEPIEGRLVSFLLAEPLPDGGQWDMLVNLINRYGLMPKKYFPESYSCEDSSQFNAILNSKLREFALILRSMVADGATDCDISAKIEEQMYTIYSIVAICLGVPPEKFIWEYIDKEKKYQKAGPLTPQAFYYEYIKPHFNMDDKVCLVTDPRSTSPYGKLYTIDCLGNMEDGRRIIYNNQPVEVLMYLAGKAVLNDEAVWFGCQVGKRFASKPGIEDLKIHDYKLVFGVDISITMTKAERMICGESMMTHAMALIGVSFDGSDALPMKWCVENSWGTERGNQGYLMMSNDWFKEYVFEVVIDKSHVPQEILDVYDSEPIVLPPWDPMGMLAN